ncbi:Bacterial Ig-like domain (group 2) [compost metagenome]
MLRSIIRKASCALLSLTLVSGIAASHGYASTETGKPVIEWSHQYGAEDRFASGQNITSTSDGGYIVTGSIADKDSGITKANILKLNSSGELQWAQKYQHNNIRTTQFDQTIETKDGGYLSIGSVLNENGRYGILLIKLSALGAVEWNKEYDYGFNTYSLSIAETKDNNFVMTGRSFGWSGIQYTYVLKINPGGQEIWLKMLKFSDEQNFEDIIATPDGGSIAVGSQNDRYFNDPNLGVVISKLNANGDQVWTRKLSAAPSLRMGLSISSSGDGGYVIYGEDSADNLYLTRIDASGKVLWDKKFNQPFGQSYFNKVFPTNEGYALFSEFEKRSTNDKERKYELSVIDNNGELSSQNEFTVKEFSYLKGLTASPDGGYVLLGGVSDANNYYMQVTKLAGPNNQPGECTLDRISFTDSGKKIAAGEHTQAAVNAHYSDGSIEALKDSVSFTSEDENTATVDSKGVITGIRPGITIIHAVYQGHSAQLQIEVTKPGSENPEPVEGTFYLDSEEYSLTEGTSIDTVAYFKDKDGKINDVTKQSIFTSDNPSVVDYDKDGNINGIRAGITYITAEYQGKSYRVLVQVVRASVPN